MLGLLFAVQFPGGCCDQTWDRKQQRKQLEKRLNTRTHTHIYAAVQLSQMSKVTWQLVVDVRHDGWLVLITWNKRKGEKQREGETDAVLTLLIHSDYLVFQMSHYHVLFLLPWLAVIVIITSLLLESKRQREQRWRGIYWGTCNDEECLTSSLISWLDSLILCLIKKNNPDFGKCLSLKPP